MKKIINLSINITAINKVSSAKGTVQQILFDGEATGELFNGTILPGGVDTQTYDPEGKGGLSARYMLKGKDFTGKECLVYIDNYKKTDEEYTHPEIYTDSEALSRLEQTSLLGKLVFVDDRLNIEIYEQ